MRIRSSFLIDGILTLCDLFASGISTNVRFAMLAEGLHLLLTFVLVFVRIFQQKIHSKIQFIACAVQSSRNSIIHHELLVRVAVASNNFIMPCVRLNTKRPPRNNHRVFVAHLIFLIVQATMAARLVLLGPS